ncbi:MAG: hypothetical protein ABI855_16640 [Bacteroidota bacterium]
MKQIVLMIGFLPLLIACSKNTADYSACPTADNKQVSYNGDIKQIIQFNCSYSPCHSSPPMDSTLVYDFTNYDGLKRAIGSVYNRINRDVSDPLHMPKGLPGDSINPTMNSCDLAKLKIWIQTGAPEN